MGMRFGEFKVGQKFRTAARTITETDIVMFTGISGDINPLHTDETYAATMTHGTRIAHGALTFAVTTGLVNQSQIILGTTIALLGVEVKWPAPVKAGDTIHVESEVIETRPTKNPGRGIIKMKLLVYNQNDVVVSEQEWSLMIAA